MTFAIRPLILATFVGTSVFASQSAGPDRSADLGVYTATLEQTIRPRAVSERGARARTDPFPVADRTVANCGPANEPRYLNCVPQGRLRSRFMLDAPTEPQVFGDLLLRADRALLAASFDGALEHSEALPRWDSSRVRLLDEAGLREQSEALRSSSPGAVGYASFSRPAYSPSGQAVLFATYTCGGLCGYGWLILLRQGPGGWEVQAAHVLWMS